MTQPGAGQNLRIFQFNKFWGYLDPEAKVVIEPVFASAENFFPNGLAKVANEKGRFGLINHNGTFVIRPELDEAKLINIDGDVAILGRLGPRWGALDSSGRWLIKPRFKDLGYVGQGLYTANYHGLWGLVSPTAGWLMKPMFSGLSLIGSFKDKNKALLLATSADAPSLDSAEEKDNKKTDNKKPDKIKYGLVNLSGKVLVPPTFDSIEQTIDDLDYFLVKVDKQYGVIDKTGYYIVPLSPTFIKYNKKQNEYWVEKTDNDSWAYTISQPGKRKLTKAELWSSVDELKWKLAPCADKTSNQEQGFCNSQGAFVIGKFDSAKPFSDFGLAKVIRDGKVGYVDITGQMATPTKFEDGQDFYAPGIAAVKSKGLWGIINSKGTWVVKPEYESAEILKECPLILVKKGGLYGLHRATGSVAFKPIFEDYGGIQGGGQGENQAENQGDNQAENKAEKKGGDQGDNKNENQGENQGEQKIWLKHEGRWGLVNCQAKWAINPKFEEKGVFDEQGLMPVTYRSKYAIINTKFEFLAYNDVACKKYVVKNGTGQIIWPQDAAKNCRD
ncbi:MAG: WG repeat-containing protein [Deltaproteobacteria bacterium]|nr:WG repeat-containing protein [Deltaproteobacteria bacterium]